MNTKTNLDARVIATEDFLALKLGKRIVIDVERIDNSFCARTYIGYHTAFAGLMRGSMILASQNFSSREQVFNYLSVLRPFLMEIEDTSHDTLLKSPVFSQTTIGRV